MKLFTRRYLPSKLLRVYGISTSWFSLRLISEPEVR